MAEALGKTLPDLAEGAFTRIEEGGVPAAAAGGAGGTADTVEHIEVGRSEGRGEG